jgi:hypothetical protein
MPQTMTIDDEDFEAVKLAVERGVTDPAFWHSRTPDEQLVALELMRQRAYGYDAHSVPKIQRVLEVVHLKQNHTQHDRGDKPQNEQS